MTYQERSRCWSLLQGLCDSVEVEELATGF